MKNTSDHARFIERFRGFAILLLILLLLLISTTELRADNLEILLGEDGDAYIELSESGDGFSLFIRAREGLGSILITESSADPAKKADSFAFRSWDWNPVNGDEKRVLDGEFLESERDLFFLVDSNPEENDYFGTAYQVFIPFHLTYGYPWSREGQVEVHQGTWLNIRTFEKPYADYQGAWRDNPVLLNMKVLPPPPPPEIFTDDDGPVDDVQEAVERIAEIIGLSGGNIDVVLAVDTTVSMKDDIGFIQNSLVPLVRNRVEDFESFRVGLLLYRDYKEAYLTRSYPFTANLDELQRNLDRITVSGGRDMEEAVNEALYASLTEFEWQAPERIIIQVGDAPGHEEPRGAITALMVEEESARLGVSVIPIRLPADQP